MISPEDIIAAREVIAAASKGPVTWCVTQEPTRAETAAVLAESYDRGDDIPVHLVAIEDDGKRNRFIAITGNGPTSAANAKYIAVSYDHVVGWAAALDEVERLQGDLSHLRTLYDLRAGITARHG